MEAARTTTHEQTREVKESLETSKQADERARASGRADEQADGTVLYILPKV